MKYGLINNSDKAAIEMALREVDAEFPSQVISILEIGIYAGETGNGMKEYLLSLDRDCFLTGIDNNADKEPIRFATAYNRLIGQDSGNAAYLIDDFSQHLIFIDGNHSYANVVADFFCYAPKLRHDGFMIFHDTGIHIKPLTHYQKTGSEKDPHKYISVREALFDIGLIQNEFKGWELVADVWDDKDEAGGVIVLKKKLKKMKISLCINIDSRPKNDIAETMFSGVSNWDFWTEGVFNKIKFFDGYDIETIIHADKHKTPPTEVINEILSYSDTLIIRKHTSEEKFNDWNYLRCLSQASGDIVVHFDQDTACFRQSKEYVDYLISLLEKHKIISYPSHWTPNPVVDESFGGKFWASTRFFMCRRETLKLDELKKCIENPDWMYEKYGDSKRRVDWFEHFLAKINGNDVFYPPVELHRGTIFSWKSYKDGVLSILNKQEYEIIKQQILHWGGIQYPCDVTIA